MSVVLRLAWLAACLLTASSTRRLSSILYDKLILPDDKTVTVAVSHTGQVVKLFYLLQKDVQSLSVTVTPCGAPVSWDLEYRNSNQTGRVEVEGRSEAPRPEESVSEQLHRLVSPASKGLYTLRLNGLKDGLVEVFATFMGSPAQLWPGGKILYKSRTFRGNVFIRWSRTTVDPDLTEYILVVHRAETAYPSLCQARERHLQGPPNNIIMEKTGKKSSCLVSGLEVGVSYRADVFALNTATNFSYRYAELPRLVYTRPKPRPLLDRVQVAAELRPHEPTLLYRYKVREEGLERLELGVTACGEGSLTAEVKLRGGGQAEDRKLVRGHAVLTVSKPLLGKVYVLKLRLPQGSSPVSAQVTARGEEPTLPEPAELHEFRGLRGCREVTLGWVPVEGEATYCLRAMQSRRGDVLRREPDQCAVEQQLNSLGYSVLQCSKLDSQDRKVLSERLTNLKPGKQYDIQISVKKGNSKRLSYKLLRVRTKSRCS